VTREGRAGRRRSPARAAQVGAILARKAAGIAELQRRLDGFAEQLRAEEALSRSVGARRA